MPLRKVTLSGADDDVPFEQILQISRDYPFVEWGILMSAKRAGEPRYPRTLGTATHLVTRLPPDEAEWPAFSAHLCGSLARDVLAGETGTLDRLHRAYRRFQLNGWCGRTPSFWTVPPWYSEEFILQVKSLDFLPVAATEARGIGTGRVSALWDPSGGEGLRATVWPKAPEGLTLGFAGGITPDNVEETLRAIGDRAESFWIDMETGVRTDNRFDCDKARRVLDRAGKFIGAAP